MRDLRLLSLFRARSRAASSMALLVFCAAVLTIGAVFFLWQRYQFIRLGFDVSGLRRQKAALEESIEPLELEVDYLSRLERIEALATGRLGMRAPRATQVRSLSPHEAPELSSR